MRGFVDLPKGLDDEFYRQLTAESRKATKTKQGFVRFEWVKDPLQANEGLDTHLQAEAAWIKIAGPTRELFDQVWARFFAERETPPAELQLDLEDIMVGSQPLPPPPAPALQTPAAPRGRRVRKMRLN